MFRIVVTYIATLVVFLGIDMVWLGWVARSTYVSEMGDLIRKQPNITAAIFFYAIYAAGLAYFAVLPGLRSGSSAQALMLGLALGLVAYATYDLTNLTVLNGYTLKIALIDLAWGTFLSGVTAMAVTAMLQRF